MPDDETRNRFDTLRNTEREQAEQIKQVQKERADGSWWEVYDTDKRLETLTQEYNNTQSELAALWPVSLPMVAQSSVKED
jgi:hypothetical protein